MKAKEVAPENVVNDVSHEVNTVAECTVSNYEEHTIAENKTDKNFKSSIDMDTLSELPIDFILSQSVSCTLKEEKNMKTDVIKSDKNEKNLEENIDLHALPNKKITAIQNSYQVTDTDTKISKAKDLVNQGNKPVGKVSNHENVYDMDVLSEFPMDFDFTRHMTMSNISNQEEGLQPEDLNVNSDKGDQDQTLALLDKKMEYETKSDLETADIDSSEIKKFNKLSVNDTEVNLIKDVYDMDALSELPMDFDLSVLRSASNNGIPDEHCLTIEANGDNDQKSIVHHVQNQIQVLHGQSLPQPSYITVNKQNWMYEDNKSEITPSPRQTGQNAHSKEVDKTTAVQILKSEQNDDKKKHLNPFAGFSTASGKKVTISKEAMKRARRFMKDENNQEKNSVYVDKTTDNKAGFSGFNRIEEGDQVNKRQYKKSSDNVVNIGFSTASGKKIGVSVESLNSARQILNDIIQEDAKRSKYIEEGVELPCIGESLPSKNKFEVPKIMSNCGGLNSAKKETDTFCRNDMKFCTASGKETKVSRKSFLEAKSILGDFERMPELSDDFLTDVEKIFADLEGNDLDARSLKDETANEDESNCKQIPDVMMSVEILQKVVPQNQFDEKQSCSLSDSTYGQLETPEKNIEKSLDGNEIRKNDFVKKSRFVFNASENITGGSGLEVAIGSSIPNIPNHTAVPGIKTSITEEHCVKFKEPRQILNDLISSIVPDNKVPITPDFSEGQKVIKKLNTDDISCLATNNFLGFTTATGNDDPFCEESTIKTKDTLSGAENKDLSEESNVETNGPHAGSKISISNESRENLDEVNNRICQLKERITNENRDISLSKPESENTRGTTDERSTEKAHLILNEDNERNQLEKKAGNKRYNTHCSTTTVKYELPSCNTISRKNVTVSERLIQKPETSPRGKKSEDYFTEQSIPNFTFSTASGKRIELSKESLLKARSILHEVDNEGHQKEMVEERQRPLAISADNITTGPSCPDSGNSITAVETSIKAAKCLLNSRDKGSNEKMTNNLPMLGFSTASGKEISVSDRSLKKAKKLLNEVDGKGHQLNSDNIIKKYKISNSTPGGENTSVNVTASSKINCLVSQISKQSTKGREDDKDVSERIMFKKLPKFALSTSSEHEICVSEKMLCPSKKVMENSGDCSDEKGRNEHKIPCSTASDINTIASFISSSETQIQKTKTVLNDPDVNIAKFPTALENKIAVSEKSVKPARRILKDIDNKVPHLSRELEKRKFSKKLDIPKGNVLNGLNCNDYGTDVRSTLPGKKMCGKEISSTKQIIENKNDIECLKRRKRSLPVMEDENGKIIMFSLHQIVQYSCAHTTIYTV